MHKQNTPSTGFTIVELLIVVVVIAILATISIVAYTNIQQRARNSQTAAGVNSYIKAIKLYLVDNASLPVYNGCLGANYPSDLCWTGANGNFAVNGSLDAALAPYVSTKPVVASKSLRITNAPDDRLGLLYRWVSSSDVSLIYYLEGTNQTCLEGTAGASYGEATQCTVQIANW